MTTDADARRFRDLQDIGCIACIIEGEKRGEDRRGTPADIHHRINGYRAGHQHTIPLCPWHHRAVPPSHLGRWQATLALGPSKAHNPKAFASEYGTDEELERRTNAELRRLMELRQ